MKLFKSKMFKKESLTVLLLFGLVLFVRVAYIPTERVWFDEVVSTMAAKQGLGEICQIASAETNTPTYYILLHYYMRFFGDSEVTLRTLSIFFGLLSSLMIFLLAKELIKDRLVPKIALFLVAVSPFHLYYSHEIRGYSILIFLSSLTLLSLVKRLRDRRQKTFWDVCYAVSLVLGAYMHITYLFYILALNLFLFVEVFRKRRRDLLVRNLLFPNTLLVGSVVLFCATGYPVIVPQILNVIRMKLAVGGNPVYGIRVEDFLSVMARVYWGKFMLPSMLVAIATLFYLGLKQLNGKNSYLFLFLIILTTSLLVPPRLPNSDRYLAYAFPVVLILLALGAHAVWQMLERVGGKLFRPSWVLVIVAMVVMAIFSIQIGISARWDGYERVASFFEDEELAGTVILVTPSWDRYVLLHYFEEPVTMKGVHTRLDEFGYGLSLAESIGANWRPVVDEESVSNLENYIRGFGDVWYVDFDPSSDPENLVWRWLVDNTNLEKIYYVDSGGGVQLSNPTSRTAVFLFRNEEGGKDLVR